MFRFAAFLGLLYIASASEICVGNVPGESLQGLCVPKIDCKSDEWEFGTTMKEPDLDNHLYYAPTHGRIGNQIEQLLGMMSMAVQTNRTLIYPDFILYGGDRRKLPFTDLFQSNFGIYIPNFKPMQVHTFSIETYLKRSDWQENFDPSADIMTMGDIKEMKDPLIATPYPLSKFPVNPGHRHMQSKLRWSSKLIAETTLPKRPYVGMHLRRGRDWKSLLTKVGLRKFMAHPQNNRTTDIALTTNMIYPDISYIKRVIQQQDIKNIFIASDVRLTFEVEQYNIFFGSVKHFTGDLYVLERSDLFIGNTVSSFSSCVTRMREKRGAKTEFFGIDYL